VTPALKAYIESWLSKAGHDIHRKNIEVTMADEDLLVIKDKTRRGGGF
jgi:hypothetical protein